MITGFTMTITPDELKQMVRKAVLEKMTVKNNAPGEMKFYTRFETCEILHISLSTLDTYENLAQICEIRDFQFLSISFAPKGIFLLFQWCFSVNIY